MRHPVFYTGATMALKFRIHEGLSFDNYRLDVVISKDAHTKYVQASTDIDEVFNLQIGVDSNIAILSVPANTTRLMAEGLLLLEERYTHKTTGFREVFTTNIEVRQTLISAIDNNIIELSDPERSHTIDRKIGFKSLSRYELAVANGYKGSEEEWLNELSSGLGGVSTLAIKSRTRGGELEYKLTNFDPAWVNLAEYRIAIRRYRKYARVNGKVGNERASRYRMSHDGYSKYINTAVGGAIPKEPYAIFWTDFAILPQELPLSAVDAWTPAPYRAKDIINRFIYALDGGKLSTLEAAVSQTPEKCREMIKVTGRNKRVGVFKDEKERTRFNYSVLCELVLFKIGTGAEQNILVATQPFRARVRTNIDDKGVVSLGYNISLTSGNKNWSSK